MTYNVDRVHDHSILEFQSTGLSIVRPAIFIEFDWLEHDINRNSARIWLFVLRRLEAVADGDPPLMALLDSLAVMSSSSNFCIIVLLALSMPLWSWYWRAPVRMILTSAFSRKGQSIFGAAGPLWVPYWN